jgi:peptide/nickel transport system permease protein
VRGKALVYYFGRRLLMLVPVTLLVTVAVFLLASLVPGGVVAVVLAGHPTDTATVEALRLKYHLNDPIYVQYLAWLGNVLHGDLGRSILTSQPVSYAITTRLPLTLELNLGGLLLALVVGVPLGILAATKQGRARDRGVVGLAVFGSSAPHFIVALVILYVFAELLGWFPLFGVGTDDPVDRAWHMVLPIVSLAIGPLAFVTKITRASMLDLIEQDHIYFARARGLSEFRIMVVYLLRNALIPVVTAAGLLLVGLLTGTVFVETIFGLPGLGGLLVAAVRGNDIPTIQGLVLVLAIWVVLANLFIDALYVLIDPRVAFERSGN